MNKQKCIYCGGHTVDDERGNCGACGAPRKESPITPIEKNIANKWYPIIDRGSNALIGMKRQIENELIEITCLGDAANVYIRGGYVNSSKSYIIGNRGSELFVPIEVFK